MEHVRSYFKPEFLNRLDEILMFNQLSRDDMGAIVKNQLNYLNAILSSQNLRLSYNEDIVKYLADKG
jgi:ATP-dependent Clp protease ATP-binding subunit ClpB